LLDDPQDHESVELVLAAAGAIEGRIVRNGEPWSGELRWQTLGAVGSTRVRVRDGRYRIGDLGPGDVRVWVESEVAGALAAEGVAAVEVGRTARLDLAWKDELATIAGRVLRGDGAPAADAIVGARVDGERSQHWTRSAADGSFALEVPPGGRFDVSAYDRVVRVWERDVPAGAEDVTLVLGTVGERELELVDAAPGSPITTDERRVIEWTQAGGTRMRELRTRLASDGTATLQLPVGRVDMAVDLTRLGYARRTLTDVLVTERGEKRRVALERGVDVRLHLPRNDARKLRRHAVFLLEESQRDDVRGPFEAGSGEGNTRVEGVRLRVEPGVLGQTVELYRRGQATLRGLVPGRYVLRVFPGDLRLGPDVIVLDQPGIVDVPLTLRAR
jgi:hypothetical protein